MNACPNSGRLVIWKPRLPAATDGKPSTMIDLWEGCPLPHGTDVAVFLGFDPDMEVGSGTLDELTKLGTSTSTHGVLLDLDVLFGEWTHNPDDTWRSKRGNSMFATVGAPVYLANTNDRGAIVQVGAIII